MKIDTKQLPLHKLIHVYLAISGSTVKELSEVLSVNIWTIRGWLTKHVQAKNEKEIRLYVETLLAKELNK